MLYIYIGVILKETDTVYIAAGCDMEDKWD